MYKQFKDLKSIKFPVYGLHNSNWYIQDKVLFTEDGRVIDDKNMPGASLGVRRLQCGRKDLLKLRKAYPDIISLLASKKNKFVDSNGVPFVYRRKIICPLKYHKVEKIEYKLDHSLIWCKDIPYPFNIPRPPYGDARWAMILYYQGSPWAIWSFSREKGKDSFRRV